jgi:hypothetical protein
MLTVNLNNLPLKETWVDDVPQQHAYIKHEIENRV